MQFDRDEFAFLSRGGRVPRSSRAGPSHAGPEYADYGHAPARERGSRPSRFVATVRRRVSSARALRAGVRATWTVFGEGQDR